MLTWEKRRAKNITVWSAQSLENVKSFSQFFLGLFVHLSVRLSICLSVGVKLLKWVVNTDTRIHARTHTHITVYYKPGCTLYTWCLYTWRIDQLRRRILCLNEVDKQGSYQRLISQMRISWQWGMGEGVGGRNVFTPRDAPVTENPTDPLPDSHRSVETPCPFHNPPPPRPVLGNELNRL